jgi:hypothetical protein
MGDEALRKNPRRLFACVLRLFVRLVTVNWWGGGSPRPRCRASQLAGAITGLFAGIGIAIAVGNLDLGPFNDENWKNVALDVALSIALIVLGTLGGSAAGAATGGCFPEKPTQDGSAE